MKRLAVDVAVVGAGIAGLAAAAALHEADANLDIVLLEARDRMSNQPSTLPARLLTPKGGLVL